MTTLYKLFMMLVIAMLTVMMNKVVYHEMPDIHQRKILNDLINEFVNMLKPGCNELLQ